MPCWPRLVSTTTLETTSSWVLPAESTSGSAPCPSLTQEIPTSSGPCLQVKEDRDSKKFDPVFHCCWMCEIKAFFPSDFDLFSWEVGNVWLTLGILISSVCSWNGGRAERRDELWQFDSDCRPSRLALHGKRSSGCLGGRESSQFFMSSCKI